MEIKYFEDTDTLLINFNNNSVCETRDINENMLIDVDENGNIVSMTLEHAKNLTAINNFSFNQYAKNAE